MRHRGWAIDEADQYCNAGILPSVEERAVPELETKDHRFVTVLGSQPLGRPEGRVAIELVTKELGSIVFEVNQQAIDVLRHDLALAELMLRKGPTEN